MITIVQRLALLDLDNTLIDLDEAFGVWAREFTADHGLGSEGFAWLIAVGRKVPHRATFFAMVRERFGMVEPVDTLWARYRQRMPDLVSCRPEVLDGLTVLRRAGWRLGIVTNGMADNQLGKIQRTGLAEVVDGWAISGTEGVRKPDVRLFAIAASRCGATIADGGWMIGDNPASDIIGGNQAGLYTILINRDGATHDVTHSVTDVLQAIELLLLCYHPSYGMCAPQ
ncbi:hypothetical protein GCM10009555_015080 [Acrocarpospora macrocephala]|uniref:Haloacid dehalogenase n=1 Tax=Acrocarpospora macrocephala TaxID=150177 RepID=A0A5M3X245_9ACTN|nr:HAD family hydrolase [Acrocarpospora macrocephala]GES14149.1 hypothetical protein Amac_077460 [Acrocarpospora macrocephala]